MDVTSRYGQVTAQPGVFLRDYGRYVRSGVSVALSSRGSRARAGRRGAGVSPPTYFTCLVVTVVTAVTVKDFATTVATLPVTGRNRRLPVGLAERYSQLISRGH